MLDVQRLVYLSFRQSINSVNLLIIGINKYLHAAMGIVLVGFNMDRITTIAAIFKVILIFTTQIQRDVGGMSAKRTNNGFVK